VIKIKGFCAVWNC